MGDIFFYLKPFVYSQVESILYFVLSFDYFGSLGQYTFNFMVLLQVVDRMDGTIYPQGVPNNISSISFLEEGLKEM